ncbi:MAG: hypothetical protein US42_C0002G0081 [Candidatus Magasanikbacteria bacterium GW2011_GWC2_37_14]|uniref:Extradiol ring-cleavage dioxygenase class III enzyme subunit B domain-containing protein n=1 Tax=Candidatus Magasanikbacteria bacterium GW2011_GWC2_37_14 TaxID=1619046 RepID=A0A0G0JJ87_9BACT|nr:MAG: hypothetical protein US42_C0002G0081 [Candidatus Magasanikbacteria bacterium GW2011_GWC2_37_14]
MLVFASITPHPPLLIPDIGKEEINKIAKTKQALEQLEQDLYLCKPDILVVISPHASLFADAFSINANNKFACDFSTFGDLKTKKEWLGEPMLAATISHKSYEAKIPVQLVSEQNLDHGSTIPLFYLSAHLPNCKVLPIGYSMLDNKTHLDFGTLLKEVFMASDKRIAVIASGDLSHGLTTNSPAGYKKSGELFDQKVIEFMENHNTVGFSQLDKKIIDDAAECGYKSFLILLGILQGVNYTFKNYSYEGPFGVGYLVGNFVL